MKNDKSLSVSFMMPMYNEEANIEKAILRLKNMSEKLTSDYEIVVVDDASTDGSKKIVERLASKDSRIKLFCLAKNTKFGGAFAEGFSRSTKDVIVYMDSDLPVSNDDIEASFPMIYENDVVTGYSKVKKGDTLLRKFISQSYNLMVRILYGLNVRDINSGYKIVRREIVKDLKFHSRSPFIDVEIFIHVKKKKGKVCQYPLIFESRKGGKSYIARIPVILATFRDMIKVRLLS
ncbi:MAG: glycosyltransferase family 2 protein [Candidatus Omnitrophica bacterium]|nr:glycosyltransferase family 2 protein [Candidatus Omnitrophota bacterium]